MCFAPPCAFATGYEMHHFGASFLFLPDVFLFLVIAEIRHALWLWKKNTLLIKKRCHWNPLTLTNEITSISASWLIWQPLSLLFVDYKAGELLYHYASSMKKRILNATVACISGFCRLKCRQIGYICKRRKIHFLMFLNECAGYTITQRLPWLTSREKCWLQHSIYFFYIFIWNVFFVCISSAL